MYATSFLSQMVILLGAALIVAWMFRVVRAPAIIGFLVCGVVLGPSGLNLFASQAIWQFADMGLVMLLFVIGLELSPEPLIRVGHRFLSATIFQIVLTLLIAPAVMYFFGSVGWLTGVILAMGVTNSSTAIVLNQLADRGQTDSPAGRLITGILLLQDILVILLMLFLPLLGGRAEASVSDATVRAIVSLSILIAVTLAARRLLPYGLSLVVRWGGRELLALFAVVMAVAGACLAQFAGWSTALGGCIAGLILSQTPLRHQLAAEILPFRDVFNAIFFISMGMLVNLDEIAGALPMIALAVAATLVGKGALIMLSVRLVRWPLRLAIYAGLGLCTVSEFAFVLAREADRLGILSPGLLPKFTAFVVATMVVGATIFPLASKASAALSRLATGRPTPEVEERGTALVSHVIVIGYGVNGQNLSRVLKATKIPYCVVEMNHSLAEQARHDGHETVIVGDAARRSILDRAGLSTARALVTSINDLEANRRIVSQARGARSDLYIVSRTRFVRELEELKRLGAQTVIPEEFETSIEIFAHVLKHFSIPDNVIEAQVTMVRAGNYGMLRGQPAATAHPRQILRLLEATATQTYLLADASEASGRTIREVNLRARTGVTIIAVVREGKPVTNPPVDFRLQVGDVLVLVGSHADLNRAKVLLAPPVSPSESQSS